MKSIRKLILSLIVTMGIACFSQTAWAETETTLTSLMEVLKEDQKEAAYNINLNAPFTKESAGIRETISTETGELILTSELFHIPGRNGMDISLDLVYRSRDAKLYEEGTKCGNESNGYGSNILALYDVFDSNGYWLRTGALKYTSSDTTIYGEVSMGDEDWTFTGYIQFEDGTSIMQEDGIENTSREKSALSASKYIFGEGWSLDMPSLILDGDSVYVTLRNGQTYQSDFNKGMGIKDYELYDVIFTEDTSETSGTDTSAYKLYYVTGDTYWFSAGGELLKEEDRFGNYVRYSWKTKDGLRLLYMVEDSAGHTVDIDYQDETISLRSGERIYTLDREAIPGAGSNYSLASIRDPEGRKVSYKYEILDAEFDLIDSANANNTYANLIEVLYPTGAKSQYSYSKSKKNLGQSGFMEYFKVTARKDVEEERESNIQIYKYYNEPDGYPTYDSYDMDDSYRYYSETTDINGLTIKHSYNSDHKQFLREVTGERLYEGTTTIYNYRNHLPEKVYTSIFDEEGDSRQSIDLYTYDHRGNLIYENHLKEDSSDPKDAHEIFYDYDYGFNLLMEKRYKQDESTTIRESYTLDIDGRTVAEEKFYSNDNLEMSKKFQYDGSGNLKTEETLQSPGVWSRTGYEYSDDYGSAYLTAISLEDVMDANGLASDISYSYRYDFSTGNIISETDAMGNTTRMEYDRLGRLTREILPDQAARTYEYKDTENAVIATDACGNEMKYFYSGLGKLVKVEDLASGEILGLLEYDNKDKLTRQYDAKGNYQTWEYDQLSRMDSTSNHDSHGDLLARTSVDFDEVHDYKGMTYHKVVVLRAGDGKDKRLTYLFDPYERLSLLGRTTETGEEYSSYGYNYVGNNISSRDFSGASEEYTYDGMNRVTAVT